MKLQKTREIASSAVYGSNSAIFEATPEEIKELRDALAVVEKWKKAARKALKTKEHNADFTVWKFKPTTYHGKVEVVCEQGANG